MSQPPQLPQQPGRYPPDYAQYAQQSGPYGMQYQQRPIGPQPKSYLVESILVTLFCCLPFGIVGIIYSAMAKSAFDRGDWQIGYANASTARTWTLVGFLCGLVPVLIYLLIMILAVIAGGASSL
jgi:hypothetical protein